MNGMEWNGTQSIPISISRNDNIFGRFDVDIKTDFLYIENSFRSITYTLTRRSHIGFCRAETDDPQNSLLIPQIRITRKVSLFLSHSFRQVNDKTNVQFSAQPKVVSTI